MSPGVMRMLLRGNEQDMMPEEAENEPHTPHSLIAESFNLFWQAGEFPGLQDVILSGLKSLKKASDQRGGVSTTPLLRMPSPVFPQAEQPMAPPPPLGVAPDLLSILMGRRT